MNPVEISEAVSDLALEPFDRAEFAFAFLAAFDNKPTTIQRLRSGNSNSSDLQGGVLQAKNIHIATCALGQVDATLTALRESPKTAKAKAQFILATDGDTFQAEDLSDGETVSCAYKDFPEHFGFFLPLAGITTVPQIRENAFDVKATGRLNKLYLQLLRENPDWAMAERQHDLNHFMARLIFCFFAEDTDIFPGKSLFTGTVETMSGRDSSDTHKVIGEIFRAMDTAHPKRVSSGLPLYATKFPYVNGQLFSGSTDVPTFSKVARTYLLHVGSLPWQKINPDIFGSMIQAVTDEAERGSLGMHYTSVPNILKVLNPLFLDDLRDKLEEAGDNGRKLLNLRNRMARIRVFDPACGSGNFLVIAYKQMRAIEAEVNRRRNEPDRKSAIPLTNFRGIELREFPAEIARLALIIAEYQSDVLYRGQRDALVDFLPLSAENWVTCGNALQLDWLNICPPTGTGVRVTADDLFQTPLDQAEIDFENAGGETFICGNPPYMGATVKAPRGASLDTLERMKREEVTRKSDLKAIFSSYTEGWKTLDYVAGWFMKAAAYGQQTASKAALVSTNSICQGQQVSTLWPLLFSLGADIEFAHTSFKWSNLARNKAGVTCVIVGLGRSRPAVRRLYTASENGEYNVQLVENINAYLIPGPNIEVFPTRSPPRDRAVVEAGGKPVEGGHLLLSASDRRQLLARDESAARFLRRVFGANEHTNGIVRYALWFSTEEFESVRDSCEIGPRIEAVRQMRLASPKQATKLSANWPHRFQEVKQSTRETVTLIPTLTAERREYIAAGLEPPGTVVTNLAFAQFDGPAHEIAILNSRVHFAWIAAVCGKFKTDYRYSNTLGWNTFPLPKLTAQNKADLAHCAENILLARESHFPKTIADLYDPEEMPDDLRRAHEANDEVVERIYIGRRFKNDTERLEKLFELYNKMPSLKAMAH